MCVKVMRVLYLAEWNAYSNSGVIRKLMAQFSSWRKMGVQARLIVFSPCSASEELPVIEGEDIVVVNHLTGPWGLSKVFKFLAMTKIRTLIRQFRPDVIYYRQASWTPGIIGALNMVPCIIVEINSNDSTEILHHGWLKSKYHLATREWLIRSAHGFVCVGNELGELYSQFRKPVQVIGNGFDVAQVAKRSPPENVRPQLIFVGSPGQAWHGLDKMLYMAAELPEYDFHIVGDHIDQVPTNVKTYGYLNWDELDVLYRQMDVGITTLALHRNSMSEVSPLKTREYLAYGIPIIGAYTDPDLAGCPFYLQLPNRENGVMESIAQIRSFVDEWKGRSIDMDWVHSRIDSTVKERQRLDFFLAVLKCQK